MRGAVLVDTGPLVALFDPSDKLHSVCERELERLQGRSLITSLAVVTEATYLLAFSERAQSALLEFIEAGAVSLADFGRREVGRARELMTRYADLPMDFADATLVVLAEQRKLDTFFTLDRRDFGVYRIGRKRPKMIPSA